MNQLIQLTNKFAEYFTQKDVNGIYSLLGEHFILEDPAFKRIEGKDKVATILRDQFEKTKIVIYKIINLYQIENTTIIEFNITMDNLILNGVDFIEWDNMKMKELRCYYNQPDIN